MSTFDAVLHAIRAEANHLQSLRDMQRDIIHPRGRAPSTETGPDGKDVPLPLQPRLAPISEATQASHKRLYALVQRLKEAEQESLVPPTEEPSHVRR